MVAALVILLFLLVLAGGIIFIPVLIARRTGALGWIALLCWGLIVAELWP